MALLSEASATGIVFGQNSRFVRVQEAAIKAKDGDALINTPVQENWFWAWISSGYTTRISGDIIKLKAAQ